MPEPKSVIVDTNILISALLKEGSSFSQVILSSAHSFYICESIIVELFKHKERILEFSKLSETDLLRFLYILLRRLSVIREDLIDATIRKEALQLCADADPDDAPSVALTKHLNGLLWTGDKKLKRRLRELGFDTFFEP